MSGSSVAEFVTPSSRPLPERTLWAFGIACGASAANIFYNQPLLAGFSHTFGVSEARAGLVATAAAVGYGAGMFFLVPLGDVVDRRKVVLTLVAVSALLMAAAGLSPGLNVLIALQFAACVAAMSPQLLIPLAVDLSPRERRGHTVGVLMLGLLSGVLLARALAGVVADYLGGWRAVYFVAAGVMAMVWMMLAAEMPHRRPTTRIRYPELMASLARLAVTEKRVWPPTIVSALSFGAFSAFWTTLSFLMHERFGKGAAEAGFFGVIGLVGALAAPLAGKLADRRSPEFALALALLVSLASFGVMGFWVAIPGLIVGVLLMDLGVQSAQVAAQTRAVSLSEEARSRLNTIYMTTRFAGGAAGSLLGALAWTRYQWTGVMGLCTALSIIALIVHWAASRARR